MPVRFYSEEQPTMLVYTGTKHTFIHDTDNDAIADKIGDAIYQKLGRRTPKSEFDSWVNSMQYMYKVLNDNDIPHTCGVAIEYSIPLTSKRVDFILSGYDKSRSPHAVIIELKQCQVAHPVARQDDILEVETALGGGLRKTTHPSYQAWSYAQTIRDFNASVEDHYVDLHPCAYLHNYRPEEQEPLRTNQYEAITSLAPLFAKGEVPELRRFLKSNITHGDEQEVLEIIDHGRILSGTIRMSILARSAGNFSIKCNPRK